MILKNLAVFSFVLFNFISYAQTISPIADIKVNDSTGVPVELGKTFTISGIVTSSNQFGNSGPGSIQDETGAISVYGSSFANKVNIGDSVTVTGVLSQYNGLAELTPNSSADVTILSSDRNAQPEVVTILQVLNQEWNGVEDYEGRLIRINNVSVSGTGDFSGGTSGKNYDISDTSGTMQIRIDESVNVAGTPIPSGKVDIIGILGQYKSSIPYNSGYQLFPRFISDIIYDGAPLILNPVVAANIDTNSFTVYFKTARKGNTKIKFGLTTALELDSLIINDDTTDHQIKVEGLLPEKTYYYRVYSANDAGTSESEISSVTTASSNPSLGTINIYFNFPVDTSVALPGNAANGEIDFRQKLLNRINHANYSIDLAVYSFSGIPEIADALVVAKQRGVKIRVVYDNRTIQDNVQTLLNAGIKISQRPPETQSFPGIMHNKFFIFDARDTIAANDWLWTGSWNITNTELEWKNNVVEINDPSITKAYQTEFEEMWGSSTDIPDPAKAKFGNMKTDNTPHSFNIGGKNIQLYFSPSDGTTSHIINAINSADYSIYMALYVFTRNDIENAIYNRFNSGADDIRSVIHDVNVSGSEFNTLNNFSEALQNPSPTLHDKYAVIDALYGGSNPVVITGSHNWSSAAENDNDENTLIISDSLIANLYMQDFKARYNDAGGKNNFIIHTSAADYRKIERTFILKQNYPNPFNPSTTISFSIPKESYVTLKIYNILGQEIKTLIDRDEEAGSHEVNFNAENLTSGIYFYSLKANSNDGHAHNYYGYKKMIYLK